jgi:predicted enzyme related to lactoylglutathione lyase
VLAIPLRLIMIQPLKFGATVIYIHDDVPGVLDFYKRAFGLETRFYDPNYEFGELETAGPSVAFATHRTGELLMPGSYPWAENSQPANVEIAFFTTNVATAFRRAVDAGAAAIAEPKVMPWGQTVAYVRSVEGTLVALCSPKEHEN